MVLIKPEDVSNVYKQIENKYPGSVVNNIIDRDNKYVEVTFNIKPNGDYKGLADRIKENCVFFDVGGKSDIRIEEDPSKYVREIVVKAGDLCDLIYRTLDLDVDRNLQIIFDKNTKQLKIKVFGVHTERTLATAKRALETILIYGSKVF